MSNTTRPDCDTPPTLEDLSAKRQMEQADAYQKQVSLDGSSPYVRTPDGYINITFQCGPIPETGVNGTTIEHVINVLVGRLAHFQAGPFACHENVAAIHHLNEAVNALEARTKRRVATGIEGANKENSIV